MQHRNLELVALLERKHEAHTRAVAQLTSARDQAVKKITSAEASRSLQEIAMKRELAKAREQIRAHAQTVGALVAENTELQAKLSFSQRLADQRSQEVEEVSARLKAARQRIVEVEKSSAMLKTKSECLENSQMELNKQLNQCRFETRHDRAILADLETELQEAKALLLNRDQDVDRLTHTVEELKRQLEFSKVYLSQLARTGQNDSSVLNSSDSAPVIALAKTCDNDAEASVSGLFRTANPPEDTDILMMKERIVEAEVALRQSIIENERMEMQYKTFVAQIERQLEELRCDVASLNSENAELQINLENARCQLRKGEDELAEVALKLKSFESNVEPTSCILESSNIISGNSDFRNSVTSVSIQNCATLSEVSTAISSTPLEKFEEHRRETENLYSQVSELQAKLDESEKLLAAKEAILTDRNEVLMAASSERIALSRAMEQNQQLKAQMIELLDVLARNERGNTELTSRHQKKGQQNEDPSFHRVTEPLTSLHLSSTMPLSISLGRHSISLPSGLYSNLASQPRCNPTLDEASKATIGAQLRLIQNMQSEIDSEQAQINRLSANNATLFQFQASMEALFSKLLGTDLRFENNQEQEYGELFSQEDELTIIDPNSNSLIPTTPLFPTDRVGQEHGKIITTPAQSDDVISAPDSAFSETEISPHSSNCAWNFESQINSQTRFSAWFAVQPPELLVSRFESSLQKLIAAVKFHRKQHLHLALKLQTASQHQQEQTVQLSQESQEYSSQHYAPADQIYLCRDISTVTEVSMNEKVNGDAEGANLVAPYSPEIDRSKYSKEAELHTINPSRLKMGSKEWEKLSSSYCQLETRFVRLMDQLSRADEDRSRLEELVAHLEFEASNLGDFVVLVTHRRQAAKRRATRREAMLARLVEDRRCLQRRLTELVELIRRSHQLLLKKTGDQTLWDELQERRKCNEGINETIGGNETKEQGKQPDSIASREERETKGEEDLLSQSLGELILSTTSENSLACLLQFFDQQLRRLIESLECNGHHSLHTEKICLDVKDPLFLRRPDVADDEAMGLLDDEYGKEGEECGSYDGYLRQSQCLDTQHSDLWSGNGSPACFQSMPELSNKTIDHQDEIHRYIRFKGGVITI